MPAASEKKIRLYQTIAVCLVLTVLLWGCPEPGLADTADDIYQEIAQNYPGEINILKKYGASESAIKSFIRAFEQAMEEKEALTEDNFNNYAVWVLMDLYFDGAHVSFFDGVFNGWNLNPDILLDAYDTGGTSRVLDLLPQSFREIGRLVKQMLFPSGDINKDGVIDLYDLALISRAMAGNFNYRCDLKRDQVIDLQDLLQAAARYGQRF